MMKQGRRGEYKPKETETAYKQYACLTQKEAGQETNVNTGPGAHERSDDLCSVPNK